MFRQYRKFLPDEKIVVAADTSSGLGDYCAVQFLSKTKIDIPLIYHRKIIATEMTNELYPVLEKIYDITGNKPVVAYERNAGGVFEMDRLASMNRLGKFTIFKMPNIGMINPSEPNLSIRLYLFANPYNFVSASPIIRKRTLYQNSIVLVL